jgi:hypothetical protein
VRSYIFTERERRLLERWIEEGVEDQQTRIVPSWVKGNWWPLADDLAFLFGAVRVMMRRGRRRGRVTGGGEFEATLRRAESSLSRGGHSRG